MTDMMKDKVVVVTGSGGGIGREIALLMAVEGAKVVVNDIGASVSGEGKDTGPAQKVVDEIQAKGGQAVANTDSVATWLSANAIIKTAMDKFGRIDSNYAQRAKTVHGTPSKPSIRKGSAITCSGRLGQSRSAISSMTRMYRLSALG